MRLTPGFLRCDYDPRDGKLAVPSAREAEAPGADYGLAVVFDGDAVRSCDAVSAAAAIEQELKNVHVSFDCADGTREVRTMFEHLALDAEKLLEIVEKAYEEGGDVNFFISKEGDGCCFFHKTYRKPAAPRSVANPVPARKPWDASSAGHALYRKPQIRSDVR